MARRIYITVVMLICAIWVVTGAVCVTDAADAKPDMLFFYSSTCEDCTSIREEYLPEFLERYGDVVSFRMIEVSAPGALDSLYALESRVGVPEAEKDYPAVYFMGMMLEGGVPVRMRLESLVRGYLANPDSLMAVDRAVLARSSEMVAPSVVDAKTVAVAYFYKQGCHECSRAKEIIDWLVATYPYVRVDSFDIADEKILCAALGLRTKVPRDKLMGTPVFFVGDDFLDAESLSRASLSALADSHATEGSAAYWRSIGQDELELARAEVENVFRSFTILAVALAGLGDGVNPCAFATIIFFVSYLGMIGRKRSEILIVGFAFAFAVFTTYFLVGLGFFSVVKQFAHVDILAKVIFGGTAVLCFVFGILSAADYMKVRAGRTSDMTLQLPAFLKKRIHATIRSKVRMESFVLGALIIGFLVSILELACTGQVYLPTITLMVRSGSGKMLAAAYLFLYNICFIIPLFVVFGIVYFGVSSTAVARAMERRVGAVKLALTVVFLLLGVLLLWAAF